MTKNLVFYLDIPIERKHEVAWLLVKNNFKAHEQFQNIFYNTLGDLIYLKYFNKTKGPYEFEAHPIEEGTIMAKINISGYEEIEKFVKSFDISYKPNNLKRIKS